MDPTTRPPRHSRPTGYARALDRLPREPSDYARLTRGPARAWWRPVFSLVLLVAVALVFVVGLPMLATRVGVPLLLGVPTPAQLLVTNLGLAGGIVATMVCLRVAHGVPAGFVHSVAGRFRWGWAGSLLWRVAPVPVLAMGVALLLSENLHWEVHPQLGWYLLVVITTTGLQCAGEEYAFRAWLLQNLGGLFSRGVLAWGLRRWSRPVCSPWRTGRSTPGCWWTWDCSPPPRPS